MACGRFFVFRSKAHRRFPWQGHFCLRWASLARPAQDGSSFTAGAVRHRRHFSHANYVSLPCQASHVFNVKNFRDVFAGDFLEEVKHLTDHLENARKLEAVVDLQDLLLRCTLDSFGRLAMGTDFGCITQPAHVDENGNYRLPKVEFMESFDYLNGLVASRFPRIGWKYLERIDGTREKVKKAQQVMFSVADRIIAEKKAKMEAGEHISEDNAQADMLDYFLRTKNFDGSTPSSDDLRDVVMNVLIAGRDTSAQTLSWAFYELALHPEATKKCRDEIERVLGKDRQPDYEAIKDLKYCTAVFNETLRMHANVPTNSLVATKDCVLAGTGTKVYAGEMVQYSPYVQGYSKELWGPDAEEFKPERWLEEKGSVKKESAYKVGVLSVRASQGFQALLTVPFLLRSLFAVARLQSRPSSLLRPTNGDARGRLLLGASSSEL